MQKTVLITGCSSGFGRALCTSFSREGYFVIATARRLDSLQKARADLKVESDVANEDSIQAAMDLISKNVSRIDVLVNNAGYSVRSAVEEIDVAELAKMYDVNVNGIVRMMKAVLPIMRRQGSGRIYNVASISGRMTGIANGGYCSSKYAVEALSEAARYECKDMGIEVCLIEPGAMDTSFFETLSKNSDEKMVNPDSAYSQIYARDLAYRKKQKKADVGVCADRLVEINRKKKLKVRYTIGVALIFRMFVKLPDRLKEWGIKVFN